MYNQQSINEKLETSYERFESEAHILTNPSLGNSILLLRIS